MIKIFYNLSIKILNCLLLISSFFNKKNKKIYEGRKNTFSYINKYIRSDEEIVWIHVSSLGEFEQAKPIIDLIHKNYHYKILVSYFSSSAEEEVKKYKKINYNFYLVSDIKSNTEKLFKLLNPKIIIIVKYEFWINLIYTAKKYSVPIISVSSVFRSNQIYFLKIGLFFRNALKNISLFLVQNEKSKVILNKINISQVEVIGDTRYDRVLNIYNNSKKISRIKDFINNKTTIVIGSSWKSDIEILRKEIERDLTDTKYIIAPHNIGINDIEYLENSFINDTIKFSELPQKNVRKRILIIDNLGMLSSLYKYCKIAFIGGGFRGALHNTLEAAVWDVPVIYGFHKNNLKFIEVKKLEKNSVGFPIRNGNEFKLIKNRVLKDRDIGKGGNSFIIKNSGATIKINKFLSKYL